MSTRSGAAVGARRKVMIVTGGSRGIGAATAVLAAAHGYAVCISYREDEAAASHVADQVRAQGVDALSVRADVSSEDDVRHLFETVDDAWGAVTCVVNNAGVLFTQARVDEVDAARLRRLFDVNIVGAFLVAKEAVLRMSTAHAGSGGSIVNVSSRAAILGSPNEYVDYAASKGAIETLTIGLAREVAGEGIRVNGVRPGIIRTDIHAAGGEAGRPDRLAPTIPMGRAGEPGEVAEAIVWLASDAAAFVTGTFIDVSGGR